MAHHSADSARSRLAKDLRRAFLKDAPGWDGSPESIVYHYTTAQAFHSIVANKQIHLSSTAYLEDSGELSYPIPLAKSVVKGVATGADQRMASAMKLVCELIDRHDSRREVYVASFCAEPDMLSQWRAYCPAGGYALGVRQGALAAANAPIRRVSYDPGEQTSRFRAVVESAVSEWRSSGGEREGLSAEEFERVWVVTLVSNLILEFIFTKAPAFEVEREIRLAFFHGGPVLFKARGGFMVPYVPLELVDTSGRFPLAQLVISPLASVSLGRDSAIRFLGQSGYVDPEKLITLPSLMIRP